MLFDDEFDGSSLNPADWSAGRTTVADGPGTAVSDAGTVAAGDDACYSPANITVADGSLQLASSDTTSLCSAREPSGGTKLYSASTTGALVRSRVLFAQTGHSVEARVYLPSAGSMPGVADAPAGWHTLGSSWDADTDTVSFYLDGALRATTPLASTVPEPLSFTNVVGADGLTGPAPSVLMIDWVRVWAQS